MLIHEQESGWLLQPVALHGEPLPAPKLVPTDRISPLPNWPFLGVSIACLRAFSAAYASAVDDATTEDVCERVVKPLTAAPRASLAACLDRLGSADEAGHPHVQPPTAFISHARKYKFADLVSAVEAFAAAQPEPEAVYVWLDIFSQYQHRDLHMMATWDTVFQMTISRIGHTCLVLAPWAAPLPLERAWILWEVLCTLETSGAGARESATLTVQLPPAEVVAFERALKESFNSIETAISTVDARNARCFTPDDEAMIHAAIANSIGHARLNERMTDALRDWLAAEGSAALARLPSDERATSSLIDQVALLLKSLGRFEEARQLRVEALEGRRRTLGPKHPSTLAAQRSLTLLVQSQGWGDESAPLVRETLEVLEANRREDEAAVASLESQLTDAAACMASEAAALTTEEAAELSLQLEGLRSKAEGLANGQVARELSSLRDRGILLRRQGRADEAEPLLRSALAGERNVRGSEGATLTTMTELAMALEEVGQLDEAEELSREALEAKRERLGPRHKETLISLSNLAAVLQAQGKLVEALPLLREAMDTLQETMGAQHSDALAAQGNLASVLWDLGQLDEAEARYREVFEGFRDTLGARHPNTVTFAQHLASLLLKRGDTTGAMEFMERWQADVG